MSRLTGNEISGLIEAYASVGKKKKKKVMHDCATHGEHAEWGVGSMIKEMHTLDEEGNITHYDVEFEHGIERNVPVEDLEILVSEAHEHYMNDDKNAEVLDEAPQVVPTAAKLNQQTTKPNKGESAKDAATRADALEYTRRGGIVGQTVRTLTRGFGSNKDIARVDAEDKASQARINQRVAAAQGQYYSSSDGKTYKSYNDAVAAKNSRLGANKPADKPTPGGGSPAGSSPAGASPSAAAKPTASGVVLAKQGGVEGKLDKATGKFTAGAFDDKEKARYAQRAPKTGPATGMLGKTSFERRTPTSAELKAAQAARAGGEKDPEKVLQSAKMAGAGAAAASKTTTNQTATAFGKNTPQLTSTPKIDIPSDLGSKPMSGASGFKPTAAPTTPAAPQMSARAQALKSGGPAGSAREKVLNQSVDVFDLVKGHLLDEGYADSEEGAMVIMVNMSEEWRETIIMELTGGKGHPGYKAGSNDHGDLEDHPAVKKGGVLTPRHGEHLGDLDDEDDEDDELENIIRDRSRARREAVRKPLRDKVKAARKTITKEDLDQLTEISDRLATAARNTRQRRFDRSVSRADTYADVEYQKQKGKTDRLNQTLANREERTGSKIKAVESLEAWVDELIAEGYDLSGYTWEEVAEIYAQELELSEAQRARENPEDHDKEEKRKYEPVRGERTPMPPRGDKRREEFEKWYAKQMGR